MQDEKLVLITGGASGIGKETAIALAKEGFDTVFTARTNESGEAARKEIIECSGNSTVSFIVCDLASLDSVRRICDEFAKQHTRLDVLVNNAGVMEHERRLSEDGFEMDFAVNYLAPFLLTNLLLPLLKASAPSRIVNVSSHLHRQGSIDFDNLQSERHFDRYQAYADSKLALMLFTEKLARDLAGSGVTANALHPGVVATSMNTKNIAHMNPVLRFFYKRFFLSPEKGAATSVYLATSPEVAGVSGEYFDKKKIAPASPLASDAALADKLFAVSARLAGLQV